MRYAVISAAVTDEIRFTDGTTQIVPGGAGIYALCGIKLWSDDVEIVTGIGEDYDELHGKWYRNNDISMKGLSIKDAKSPYTVIQYFEDGKIVPPEIKKFEEQTTQAVAIKRKKATREI